MTTANLPDPFSPGVSEKLGVYVYALRDPRDRSVFYVGKGKGDRVYSHVWVAMGEEARVADGIEQELKAVTSAKNARIQEIHAAGKWVEHFILRHQIESGGSNDDAAFAIEQTLIDAFRLIDDPDSDPPTLTNIAGGHTATPFGVIALKELIAQYAAQPAGRIEKPFVVLVSTNPMYKSSSDQQIYNGLAGWWFASKAKDIPELPVFVVHAGLIRAVFRAESWSKEPVAGSSKWRFHGSIDPELDSKYRGKSLSYTDIDRDPHLKNWSTGGWHLYV